PQTTIHFEIAEAAPVRVDVYTIEGRLVNRIYSGLLSSGEHHFQWHGDDNGNVPVASGVYVVQVHTPIQRQSQKIMLVR
ncbi:MAG: T9SS type A sorting domain-containing protein, partial [Calditrichaeota bacterium]|nr:T9SS type A sorting domain-containing protein [Calditrichota bacterium]